MHVLTESPQHAAGTLVLSIIQMRRPRPERWYNLFSDTQLARVRLDSVGSIMGFHPVVKLSWVPSICQDQPKWGDKGATDSPPVTSEDNPVDGTATIAFDPHDPPRGVTQPVSSIHSATTY